MNISVRVKPQAKQDKVEKRPDNSYLVWVKAKALEDKANQAALKVLSEYFAVPKRNVILLKGKRARDKVFAVNREG